MVPAFFRVDYIIALPTASASRTLVLVGSGLAIDGNIFL